MMSYGSLPTGKREVLIMNSSIGRIRRPLKREGAERYLMLTLVSFAASVILIRLFLNLAGYPQVGSGELHIAHVLWGGLLLFVASLLPLLFANRWAYTAGALSAGVGVGLFIDEVGKFITQANDYFFPAAAPIIYAFFLLTVMLYLQVRRPRPRDARAELYYALDAFGEVLDRDLDAQERHDLDAQLQRVIRDADQQPDTTRLAGALRGFLASDALYLAPASTGFWERWSLRLREYEARWVSPRRLKGTVVGGLGISGLWALGSLAALSGMVTAPPDNVEVYRVVSGPGAGTHSVPLESVDFGTLLAVSTGLVLRALVGLLLVTAAILLIRGWERRGAVLGYFGLLFSLTTVTLLDFYFSQFEAIVGATVQFALLMGVILYRRRYLASESGSGLPSAHAPGDVECR
jgi:hypothetical protein